MSDWDIFSGQSRSTNEQPRFWTDHPARDWHIQAAGRADTITSLEKDIDRETDPARRHALLCRLATLTGVPAPEFIPPSAEPAQPKDWEDFEGGPRKSRRT